MSNVTPIRDPWDEANNLIERLNDRISEVPGDEMAPGYHLLSETRSDMQTVVRLLRDVNRLVNQQIARETPRLEQANRAAGL